MATQKRWLLALPIVLLLSAGAVFGDSPGQRLADERAGLDPASLEVPAASATERASAPAAQNLGIVRRASRILVEGDIPDGETGAVTSLNAPFTNSLGEVGFTGDLDVANANDRFVWADDGIVWHNEHGLPAVLAGAESTMGIGNAGQFIYSPTVDGGDAVWSHNGAILVEGDPAPGFPGGVTNIFNSRPTMNADGRAYWVAGFNDAGGTSSLGRALYTSATAAAGDVQVVLRSDDLIDGLAIDRPVGINFDYDFSENHAHRILDLLLDTGSSANDAAIAVDSALVAREGSSTGGGDNWAFFDSVSINGAGHYLFSGDTDGVAATDEFIAYDGAIVLREGDSVAGHTLTSPATVAALSIDEGGSAVHLWSVASATELLFFACDGADPGNAALILATGDGLDFDGDDVADATVVDFNASSAVGPGLELATAGPIYVNVDIDEGGGSRVAIVALLRPLCMPFLDGFESNDTDRWSVTVS